MKRPDSNDDVAFVTKVPTRLKTCNDNIFVLVITVQYIQNMSQPANIAATVLTLKALSSHIDSAPLMLHTTTYQPLKEFNGKITS